MSRHKGEAALMAERYGVSRRVIECSALHIIPMPEDARLVLLAQSRAVGSMPSKRTCTFKRSERKIKDTGRELAALMAKIGQRMTGDKCTVVRQGDSNWFRVLRWGADGEGREM